MSLTDVSRKVSRMPRGNRLLWQASHCLGTAGERTTAICNAVHRASTNDTTTQEPEQGLRCDTGACFAPGRTVATRYAITTNRRSRGTHDSTMLCDVQQGEHCTMEPGLRNISRHNEVNHPSSSLSLDWTDGAQQNEVNHSSSESTTDIENLARSQTWLEAPATALRRAPITGWVDKEPM